MLSLFVVVVVVVVVVLFCVFFVLFCCFFVFFLSHKVDPYMRLSGKKEGHLLLNDALNIYYLRIYDIRHMIKGHSRSERGNPLPPNRLFLVPINSKVILYAPSHFQDNTYHGLCYTSRAALAGTRNSLMGPLHDRSIQRLIAT